MKKVELTEVQKQDRELQVKHMLTDGLGLTKIQESFKGTPYALRRTTLNNLIHKVHDNMRKDFETRIKKSTKFNDTHLVLYSEGKGKKRVTELISKREALLRDYRRLARRRSKVEAAKLYGTMFNRKGYDNFTKS
jgi:hypothetical protein